MCVDARALRPLLTPAPCPAPPTAHPPWCSKKIRGPAPLSLALAHCDINEDIVTFTTWSVPLSCLVCWVF